MARSIIAGVLVCLLFSAAGCSAEPSNVSDDAIIDDAIVGGTADLGHPAVVAIAIGHSSLCTGTLVAPDVVLTARHCVSETTEIVECARPGSQIRRDRDPRTMSIHAGSSAFGRPIAWGRALVVPSTHRLCGADAAAIVLDRKVTGIAPLRIASPPDPGARVTAVGYGKDGAYGQAGWKKKRSLRVLALGSTELEVGEGTCPGDSGGPLLDSNGDVVGIVSRGRVPCDRSTTTNVYSRADVHEDLVRKAVLE